MTMTTTALPMHPAMMATTVDAAVDDDDDDTDDDCVVVVSRADDVVLCFSAMMTPASEVDDVTGDVIKPALVTLCVGLYNVITVVVGVMLSANVVVLGRVEEPPPSLVEAVEDDVMMQGNENDDDEDVAGFEVGVATLAGVGLSDAP